MRSKERVCKKCGKRYLAKEIGHSKICKNCSKTEFSKMNKTMLE